MIFQAIRATILGVVALTLLAEAAPQPSTSPELLEVRSGNLTLRAPGWIRFF
jgi:hypothetical protein